MSLRFAGIFLLTVAPFCGCAVRGNVELLEARLREQETAISDMHSELTRANAELASARREVESLHAQLKHSGNMVLLPEQAHSLSQLTSVEIDKFRSGGLENDGKPGDDALNAVLVPRDATGDVIKVPARIELSLFDLADSKKQESIGRWTFDANDALAHWHRGFLGSGFQFRLPWQTVPRHDQLVLHAQLKTADGREFNISETINVQPPGPAPALAGSSRTNSSAGIASPGRPRVDNLYSDTVAGRPGAAPVGLSDETAGTGATPSFATHTLEESQHGAIQQVSGTAPPLADDASFSVTPQGKNLVLTPRGENDGGNVKTHTIRSGPPRRLPDPVDLEHIATPVSPPRQFGSLPDGDLSLPADKLPIRPRQAAPFPDDADLNASVRSDGSNRPLPIQNARTAGRFDGLPDWTR